MGFLGNFEKFPRKLPETFRKFQRMFPGKLAGRFQESPGDFPASRNIYGNVLAAGRTFAVMFCARGDETAPGARSAPGKPCPPPPVPGGGRGIFEILENLSEKHGIFKMLIRSLRIE